MRDRPQQGPPDKKAAAPAVTPGQRPAHQSDSCKYSTPLADPENRRVFGRAKAIGARGWLRLYLPSRPRDALHIGDHVAWLLSIGREPFEEHVRLVDRLYCKALAGYQARHRRRARARSAA